MYQYFLTVLLTELLSGVFPPSVFTVHTCPSVLSVEYILRYFWAQARFGLFITMGVGLLVLYRVAVALALGVALVLLIEGTITHARHSLHPNQNTVLPVLWIVS